MDYVANINGDKFSYIEYENSSQVNDLNQLFYYKSGSSWYTLFPNDVESYIGVYFKQHVFIPSIYSMRSSDNPKNDKYHPINWNISGSLDGIKWHTLDRRINEQSLNGYAVGNKFNTLEIPIRHIRFNHYGLFGLRHLEFFGILTSPGIYLRETLNLRCSSFNYIYPYIGILT